jgi:glycosyltransferase involved in cell wall biosynthesis
MYDFSVIMATYNSAQTVARALESLGRQKDVSIQFIVVDGLSTDNTVEVINEILAPDILISEPDKGIAQAWNKGLSSVKGKYIAFLNSDDVYPDGYLKSRLLHLNSCPPKTISFSDTIIITDDGKSELVDGRLNENLSHGIGFSHTSCIFPKAFINNYRFDEDIKVAIDIDQLFFAIKHHWRFQKAMGESRTGVFRFI